MSSNQLTQYAVTDASVEGLKTLFSRDNMDFEVFAPRLRGTSPSTLPFYRRVDPQTNPAFGQTLIFQLDDSGDFAEEVTLELQISQVTQTGGTFVALKNNFSTCIDTLRCYQAGTLLQEVTRFDLQCFEEAVFQSYEDFVNTTEANGVLPFATRSARAAAGTQNFYINLNTFLNFFSCPLSLLTSPIRVELTFKPMLNLIQYDGTNPQVSILNAVLRVRYINVEDKFMAKMLQSSKQVPILFPFVDKSFSQNDYASNTTQIRFLLNEFKSLVGYMGWFIREVRQVNDTTGNPNWEITNSVPITDWNLIDKGVNIISNPDNRTNDQIRLCEIPWIFNTYSDPALRFTQFYEVHSFSIEPLQPLLLMSTETLGYYDFSKTQSAYLQINLPADANPIRLTAFAWYYNVLIFKNGSITKFTL